MPIDGQTAFRFTNPLYSENAVGQGHEGDYEEGNNALESLYGETPFNNSYMQIGAEANFGFNEDPYHLPPPLMKDSSNGDISNIESEKKISGSNTEASLKHFPNPLYATESVDLPGAYDLATNSTANARNSYVFVDDAQFVPEPEGGYDFITPLSHFSHESYFEMEEGHIYDRAGIMARGTALDTLRESTGYFDVMPKGNEDEEKNPYSRLTGFSSAEATDSVIEKANEGLDGYYGWLSSTPH